MDKEIKPPFMRTPHNYDTTRASNDTGLKCLDPTLTQQQFKDECDINTIVERFKLTGEVPTLQHLPTYGDFTGIHDFQSAMNAVVAARETFMSLPAKLRKRFHNDPQEFIEFCSDDANRDEAKLLGLLKPDEIKTEEPPTEPLEQPKPPKGGKTPPKPLDPPKGPKTAPDDD